MDFLFGRIVARQTLFNRQNIWGIQGWGVKVVKFSLEEGKKYFGEIDGQRFYIGSRVPYKGNKELANSSGTAAQRYDRNAFREKFQALG